MVAIFRDTGHPLVGNGEYIGYVEGNFVFLSVGLPVSDCGICVRKVEHDLVYASRALSPHRLLRGRG